VKIRITPDQKLSLEHLATQRSSSPSTLAREAIQQFLLDHDSNYRASVHAAVKKPLRSAGLIAEDPKHYGHSKRS
jgi:predicted transcriptional regulator